MLDILRVSQHMNALTGAAGVWERSTAAMKVIVVESLAWQLLASHSH
jgi:hypothetical protein